MTLCDHCNERTIHPELTIAFMHEKKMTPFTKARIITLCGQCLMEFYNEVQKLVDRFKEAPEKVDSHASQTT